MLVEAESTYVASLAHVSNGRRFLELCADLIAWLEDASEEESSEED